MKLLHKIKFSVLLVGVSFIASPCFAQTESEDPFAAFSASEPAESATTQVTPGAEQQPVDKASFLQGMQTVLQSQGGGNPASSVMQPSPEDELDLGDVNDPQSPLYKANQLAKKAEAQRSVSSMAGQKGGSIDNLLGEESPPPDVEELQRINESQGGLGHPLVEEEISKEFALDMRKEAQKEAALSYGARGGLAKRHYQIMESMQGFDQTLDRVFDFRQLLVKTPSGLLIEPPIVKESIDALVITEGGNEAAVADKVFDINKKAKIVSAPRDWRQYLIQTWSEVPPPPRILWPKNKQEQADWSTWVDQGWRAGVGQAEQIFESNVNRLVADYRGMVRYRMLLTQGMISEPYAMHEDRGVTGDKNQMRVGDRALRITGPSQFLTGAELWKPADR